MKSGVFLISLHLLALSQIVILTEAIVLPDFYPFGTSEGDQVVPRNDDGSSGEVPISIAFPFFDQNHKSLFVSTLLFSLYVTCRTQ